MANTFNRLLWLLTASIPIFLLLTHQVNVWRGTSTPHVTDRTKIAVVFAGIAAYAHLEKAQPVIAGLVEKGYPVTFVTGEEYRDLGEATGAQFEPLDGPHGMAHPEEWAAFFADPGDGESKIATAIFVNHMQEHLDTLQRIFAKLRTKFSKIVYIHDNSFCALLPVQLGAPGILPSVSMGYGIAPIALDSDDTYPFPATHVPDTTDQARRMHRLAYQNISAPIGLAMDKSLHNKLQEMGAIKPYPNFWHSFGAPKDQYLVQLGIPEFEYNRTDMTSKLRFLGIPERPGGSRDLPSWWQDVLAAKAAGKKVVVVSQGHASLDLQDLLVPTIESLRDQDDILVVAATVSQEPVIEGLVVPPNTRLVKFIPFDLIFQHTDLLVSTGGYGTVLHAIRLGVPMVLAGLLQDKAHVATLAEHVGIAINLKTDRPSIDALQAAIFKILGSKDSIGDASYSTNVKKLQTASKKYDPVQRLDAAILESIAE